MSIDTIKNILYLINDPILVLDSKTVSERLVLLGELYINNRPVTTILELNPRTRSGNNTYTDIIKVASAYPRSNLQNLLNNSNIRFIATNKSRVEDWLKVNRLQLPLPNSQSDSAYRGAQFINVENLDVTSEIEIAVPSMNIIPSTD
jgi:hypothetical protein